MPELPEVETTLRGVTPHIIQQPITRVIIRHAGLRWPISKELATILKNQVIRQATRRGKYLLFTTSKGTMILHLGMSGSLRVLTAHKPVTQHDHFDIEFANKKILRFNDPRRFGAFLFTQDIATHPLLRHLGPEPLSKSFSGRYLWQCAQKRKVPIKTFIMNSRIVVGVGNIYANEALFLAKINPLRPAGKITLEQYNLLCSCIKKILQTAIAHGGTTLKNFLNSDGKPGYFKLRLKVYGRSGLPCKACQTLVIEKRLGQRSTVFCPYCQK